MVINSTPVGMYDDLSILEEEIISKLDKEYFGL
ncbi:MAG: hypothetical protein KatS3mg068_0389 [Candidatus Sericytochromatia bacterium]|nr:MAG: hypothetical protein KatS3mg068_0389 [Candidatus Sericytochromatia bacterium]